MSERRALIGGMSITKEGISLNGWAHSNKKIYIIPPPHTGKKKKKKDNNKKHENFGCV